MKYGDRVILVQKSTDGSLRRLNAIVLASTVHIPLTHDRKPLKDAEACAHVDIAFAVPTLVPDGGVLKTRDTGEIFRPAYDVAPYTEGAWIGYEVDPEKAEGLTISVAQLVELSHHVIAHAPELEISPDAVVPSACKLIDDKTNLVKSQTLAIGELEEQIGGLKDNLDAERKKCGAALAEIAKLKAAPSGADLDAIAAEKAAKEATQS